MGDSADVLLIDGGELEDVQQIVESLGSSFVRIDGSESAPVPAWPRKLLITSSERVDSVSLPEGEGRDSEGEPPVAIVVAGSRAGEVPANLREKGFDYLVRRPVHPEALRLLLLSILYAGEERRREARYPIGYEIPISSDGLERRATLADLSYRGCRLVSAQAFEVGKRVKVTIPEGLGAVEPLQIEGQIIRTALEERPGQGDLCSAAVVFVDLPSEARQELEWVLEERMSGPAIWAEEAAKREEEIAAPPDPGSYSLRPRTREVVDPRPPERRRQRRVVFDCEVQGVGDSARWAIVGRDLSTAGMRIDAIPELELGASLVLALYGSAREEPVLVRATVARDDGEGGMLLAFQDLEGDAVDAIEKIMSQLPTVEALRDGRGKLKKLMPTEIRRS